MLTWCAWGYEGVVHTRVRACTPSYLLPVAAKFGLALQVLRILHAVFEGRNIKLNHARLENMSPCMVGTVLRMI